MELDERNGLVGGNKGYVGYSMSKRASEARRSGRFPKTYFKRYYGMSEKVLSGLVDMGLVSDNEWHHTSKFGNRTVFYSFSEPSYLLCWEQCSDEIKRMFGKGDLDGVRELFDKFLADDVEKQNNEHAMYDEYKAYCDDYRKRNDLFDPNKSFKASNGCIVKIEDNVPIVYMNGDRLSKRHGKNLRDAAMSEYLKEKDRWKDGMLSYGDYFNKNGHDMEINESVVERIVRESLGILLCEAMSSDEVYSKYYSDIDRSVFDSAVKADPTSKGDHAGKYVKWIMGLYRNGSWKPGDSYETKDALSRFDRLKGRLEKKDINMYGSVMELMNAVSGQRSSMDVKKEGAEKVYEDPEWLVIVPHTEEASKLYGKGTKWCTAADLDNWFDYYNNQGPLYININKKTGAKYQFHFPTRSFMDAEDNPVSLSNIGLSKNLIKYYDIVHPYFKSMVKYDLDTIHDFVEGYAVVSNGETGLQNMIDKKGRLLSKDKWFYRVYDMHNGFARVTDKNSYNYLGTNGKLLSDGCWFWDCYDFNDGWAPVKTVHGWWNYVNKEGEFLFGKDMDGKLADAGEFREGLAVVCFNGDGHFGYNFIDTNGKLLCDGMWFLDAYSFHDGLAQVQLKDKSWNYIKKDGALLRKDMNFSYADNFHDGRAAIRTSSDVNNGKFLPRAVYLIDTDGNIYDRHRNLVSSNPDNGNGKPNEPDMVSESMVERIVRDVMESLLR